MNFVISLVFAYCFGFFGKQSIKNHAVFYYIGATILSGITIFMDTASLSAPISTLFTIFFSYGTLSTALFTLVMYMNAVPNGSKFQKHFMPLRGELSIIACILALGHNLFTGQTYFDWLLNNPERLQNDLPLLYATYITIVLIILLLPLFITSFKTVRKKMAGKQWKKLQRWAYLFYMLIYIHIMLLMVPSAIAGNGKYLLNVVVYSVVFLGYATLRILKQYRKSKEQKWLGSLGAVYLIVAGIFLGLVQYEPTPIGAEGDLYANFQFSNYEDGVYTGKAEGYSGLVTVTVTITDGKAETITLDHHTDDQPYMDEATWVRRDILMQQSLDVDMVTGATFSTQGIIDAVYNALEGISPE